MTHSCRWLSVATQCDQLLAHLATIPVTVHLVDGGIRVYGLTPTLCGDITRDAEWTNIPMEVQQLDRCTCKLKTACVPAGGREVWGLAMERAPFGSGELQTAWPYLGATVTSPDDLLAIPSSQVRVANAVAPGPPAAD